MISQASWLRGKHSQLVSIFLFNVDNAFKWPVSIICLSIHHKHSFNLRNTWESLCMVALLESNMYLQVLVFSWMCFDQYIEPFPPIELTCCCLINNNYNNNNNNNEINLFMASQMHVKSPEIRGRPLWIHKE